MSRASSASSIASSSSSFHVGSSSVAPVDEKEYERLHKILESRRNIMRVGLKELDLTARSLRAINMARKRSAKDSTKGHHLFYRLRKEELKASGGDSQSTSDLIAKINAEWAAMSKEQKEAYDVNGPDEKLHPKVLAIKKRKQLADEEVGQDAVASASSSSKATSRKRRKAPAAPASAPVEEHDDGAGEAMDEEEKAPVPAPAKKKAAKKKQPARAASSKKASSAASGGEKRKSRSKKAAAASEGADSSAAAAPAKKGRSRSKSASGSGAAGKKKKGGEVVSSDD